MFLFVKIKHRIMMQVKGTNVEDITWRLNCRIITLVITIPITGNIGNFLTTPLSHRRIQPRSWGNTDDSSV